MFGYDLGIDLGTSSIVISVPGKGIVVNEPSYVAYDTETEKILYAGRRAYYLEGREPSGVSVIQPIINGAITNYSIAVQMVEFYINKIIKKSIFKPRVVAAVSALATDVERRTLISVIITAGARSVCLVEEPLCAAFGAGVDPLQPTGAFVIDIGGGTTDMAVISQGSMSQIDTVHIAGNRFDEEITRYMRDKYGVLIGKRTAEEVKNRIAGAMPRDEDVTMQVKGRDMFSNMPAAVEVDGNEIYECLKPLFEELTSAASVLFERTTPQLVADITESGAIITGGCSEIYGIDKLFSEALGIDVTVAPRAQLCVAKGAMTALNKMHILDQYGYRFKTKQDVRIR
ncbi:MAG: rod shape-determining protein [Eubacterium sp.]|mgnify:CR=1 FL=1|uniref:rod shape-determining protein n=1 Tax=Eubacterium sp. TaxID=142586 RepID=UPI003A2273EF